MFMKRWIAGILPLTIAGVVLVIQARWQPASVRMSPSGEEVYVSSLPDLGPAPAWMNENWLNTEMPLRLENLRGKVVLIDMWTFG